MKNAIKRSSFKIFILLIAALVIFPAYYQKDFSVAYAREIPPTLIFSQCGKLLEKGIQKVELYATYENKGLFAKNITVIVKDLKTGKQLFNIEPKENAGYSPDITLADFTGDGIKEIFLGIDSGGSGAFGYYYIYSIKTGKVNTLFDFASLPDDYSAKYSDGYKVTVTYTPEKRDFLIDLSGRDKEYLDSIYNSDGTLKKPVTAYVSAVNTVYPFFSNTRNKFDILVMRRITGLYNADSLGYTQDFMTYNGKVFETYYRTVAIN